MRGHVDGIERGEIHGWVYDDVGSKEALNVSVFVDGRSIGEHEAAKICKDLSVLGFGEGRCGFAVPFTEFHHHNLPCEVSVYEVQTGRLLPPGKMKFVPTPPPPLDIRDIEAGVRDRINQTVDLDELNAQLAVFCKLFGLAIDRANALAHSDREKTTGFREQIAKMNGLGAAVHALLAALKTSYPPIVFDAPERPEVSIVIPVCNNFELTYNCLQSVYKYKQRRSFEIIIVDDLSRDERCSPASFYPSA